ncbi:porin family protein [Flavobacteriaceae bacterium LMO-SS05]
MKPILTILVAILITISGYSQVDKTADKATPKTSVTKDQEFEPEIKYGVRGAFNISNLDFTPSPTFDNKHRNNVAFGGFVEFIPKQSYSILAELQYSAEGGGKDEALRVTYIQLPILFRLHLGTNFSIGAGPQVGIKTWSYEDGIKNIAYSGVAGIEYMLSDMVFLDARYTYGLTNILDDSSSFEARNTNIQIGIGIKMK